MGGLLYCLCLQQVKARGNVESWLGLVEDSMVVSLRKLTKAALVDFEEKPRHIWATQHASQVHNMLCILYSAWPMYTLRLFTQQVAPCTHVGTRYVCLRAYVVPLGQLF